MNDDELQECIKVWISHKMSKGHSRDRAFSDILGNSEKNVRTISDQISEKRAALDGVETAEVEKALKPFYTVARREERILVNAKTLSKSEWRP